MKKIEIKGLNEVIYKDTCENGLDVYMWINPKVKANFAALAVKYGSIHTEFSIKNKTYKVPNGIAHFLEHIKFNEKDGTQAHDFYYKNGAEVNAFTTFDYTSYHMYCLNKFEENLVHLLDFVQEPFFNKTMIQKEKGIIIEEEKMGEDDPDTLNYFGIFENLFEKCKYKNLVTGNVEDIKSTSLDDIEKVFDNFYHPENMFLVVTGNFNPYEIMQVIKENQNSKEFSKFKNPKVITPKEKNKVYKEYVEKEANVVIPKIKIGVKVERKKLKDFTDLELRNYLNLALNMNFGSTSDFKDFLEENHLASNINAMCDIYDNYLVIVVAFESRFANEVIKLVKEKLASLEICENTLNRKKKARLASLILGYDDIEKVNYNLQDIIINYNDVVDDPKALFENITVEKLTNIIKCIDFTNVTTHVLKPKEASNE